MSNPQGPFGLPHSKAVGLAGVLAVYKGLDADGRTMVNVNSSKPSQTQCDCSLRTILSYALVEQHRRVRKQ